MPFNNDVFVNNVYAIRKEKHLRMSEIEKATGVSIGYFARIKNEQKSPSAITLVAACEALGVTVEEILDPYYVAKKEAKKIDELIEQLQKEKNELFDMMEVDNAGKKS